jgi:hypothetical protein
MLIRSLQIGEVVTTIPTIGFNVESVTYKNLNFNVWVRLPFPQKPPSLIREISPFDLSSLYSSPS